MHNKWFNLGLFLLAILIALYICFYRLGASALENWDEAWYADITRNMAHTGNLIVPVWNRTVLLDKPPLQMWLTLPFVLLLGANETSVRLISALAGFLTIMLTVLYAYRRWGAIPAAFAFITLALNNTFIWRARSGNLDSLLTLLVVLSFLIMLSDIKIKHVLLGFVLSLIYLSKASVVVFPLAVFVLYELLFWRKNFKKNLPNYAGMLIVMMFLPGIWLLSGYLTIGWPFVKYYLFNSDQGVTQIALSHFKIDYVKYLYYALQRRFAYVFVVGILFAAKNIRNREPFVLLCYSLLLIFLLSLTERSNNWYLLPSMPFWSLMIAYGIYQLSPYLLRVKSASIPFAILFVLLSAYISVKTFSVNIQSIIYASGPVDQKNASLRIAGMSQPDNTIIRTDGLYPTAVYYTDRKVLSYKPEWTQIHATFIGQGELTKCLNAYKCPYLSGPENETRDVISRLGSGYGWRQVYKSGQEVVMRLEQ